MPIRSFWFWEAPQNLSGIVVVIDIWAATTNLNLFLGKKHLKKLIIINEERLSLAQKIYSRSVLVGESHSLLKKKFLCSNFPEDIERINLKDKTVLYVSDNGTRVLGKFVPGPAQVITAAFTNLSSVADFLKKQKKEINLIMAGRLGEKVFEDEICANILLKKITKVDFNWGKIKKQFREFIKEDYQQGKYFKSMDLTLKKDIFKVIPECFLNPEGFLEIKNFVPLD